MQSVPDDVRRIWDSEWIMLPDDDVDDWCGLITISDYALFDLSDPDEEWDDYRTDDYGNDPEIEVALDGCPFDTDELSEV